MCTSICRFPTESGRTDPLFWILGGMYPSIKSKRRKQSFIVKGNFQHNICLDFYEDQENIQQPPSWHVLVRNQWDNFNVQCHLFCSPNEVSFISIRHTLAQADSFFSLHLDRNAVGILIGVWPYRFIFKADINLEREEENKLGSPTISPHKLNVICLCSVDLGLTILTFQGELWKYSHIRIFEDEGHKNTCQN